MVHVYTAHYFQFNNQRFVRFGLNFYILRHRVSLHAQPTVGLTAERGSGSDKILKYLIHSDTEREGERTEKVKRQGKTRKKLVTPGKVCATEEF